MSYVQKAYNLLRGYGMSEAGALGMVGNWQAEANCDPCRVEGDYSSFRSLSKQYVDDITNGRLSRENFARDGRGFGLSQWTFWSRKRELYDDWKTSGLAIDSLEFQAGFAIKEMKRDFPELWKFLCTTNDIYQACARICREFERPAFNNIDARYNNAVKAKGELDLTGESQPAPSDQTQPSPPPKPSPSEPQAEIFWPPRTVDHHCGDWPEVAVLNSVLFCRGYIKSVYWFWDEDTTEAVKRFQTDNDCTPDGVVGPQTWGKLFAKP